MKIAIAFTVGSNSIGEQVQIFSRAYFTTIQHLVCQIVKFKQQQIFEITFGR